MNGWLVGNNKKKRKEGWKKQKNKWENKYIRCEGQNRENEGREKVGIKKRRSKREKERKKVKCKKSVNQWSTEGRNEGMMKEQKSEGEKE